MKRPRRSSGRASTTRRPSAKPTCRTRTRAAACRRILPSRRTATRRGRPPLPPPPPPPPSSQGRSSGRRYRRSSPPYWGQTEATPGPAVPASLTEKALEAPEDIHPAERSDAPPSLPPAESTSPVPPTKEEPESPEPRRARIVAPEPDLSPESKKQQQQQKKKLHKEKDKGGASIPASASQGSGFRKLFGRNKNRQSKLPEDAAGQLREMGVHDEQPAPQTTAPAPQPEELSAATAAAASHEEATFPPHLERRPCRVSVNPSPGRPRLGARRGTPGGCGLGGRSGSEAGVLALRPGPAAGAAGLRAARHR
ncbi:hypothetical protein VTK73DRAFT_5963 [Phialemonium thermophilum]|uniref:Uncharacterized protein n=1 Tax=Phialemonium thermophilum TaxID=223376 RepID=A0ABR3V0V5_9PEZI